MKTNLKTAIQNVKQSWRTYRNEQHRKRMCEGISKDMLGLEIGPSYRPCVMKRDGYLVETIDHLDQQGLVKKYRQMGMDTSKIEPVDYVWDGRSYSELTGKRNYYDYIIASHVIEHTTDFVGFLRDCSAMLKKSGGVVLAVPDKRYTLDHYRMVTTLDRIVNDYLSDTSTGTLGAFADFRNFAVRRGSRTAWARELAPFNWRPYTFSYGQEQNTALFEKAMENPVYHDVHQYVFTPASFCLLMEELRALKLIDLSVASLKRGTEFIVVLRKEKDVPVPISPKERMKLVRRASRENLVL